MKFNITSTALSNTDAMIKRYPFIKDFSFKDLYANREFSGKEYQKVYIDLNSIDDLAQFMKKLATISYGDQLLLGCCAEIIIGYNNEDEMFIEIYDDYRE